MSSVSGLNVSLSRLSLEELNIGNEHLGSRTGANRKMFPYSRYMRIRQNKIGKLHMAHTPFVKSKTNISKKFSLSLLYGYNIRKGEIVYMDVLYPDGLTVPVRFASNNTIAKLINRLKESEPSLAYKQHEIVTYCPHRIITNMPRALTLKAIGLTRKSVIVIKII